MGNSLYFVLLYRFLRKQNKQTNKPAYLSQGNGIWGVMISIFEKLNYVIGIPVLDLFLIFCMYLAAWSLILVLGNGRKEAIIQLMQRNPVKEQERHPSPPCQLQKICVYRELSFLVITLSLPLSARAIIRGHK